LNFLSIVKRCLWWIVLLSFSFRSCFLKFVVSVCRH
jgi:hypothetical protein